MSNFSATPRVWIDIYPFEGGNYRITGYDANLLSMAVWKNIRSGQGGFTLNLAPGGPFGTNTRPYWNDIITPSSLVVIGMQRFSYKQIVMIGYVKPVSETTTWTNQVQRSITIEGVDFQGFFRDFYYYTLSYLGGTQGAALGPQGLPSLISQSLLHGTPAAVAQAWYQKIMAGPNGILGNLAFNYRDGNPTFDSLMSSWFEAYPDDVTIPLSASFIPDEDTWDNKMRAFLPFPWYEFFVITAPVGMYGSATPAAAPLSMDGFAPASPTLVARVNPLPYTPFAGTISAPSFNIDTSRWDALPAFTNEGQGFLTSSLGWDASQVRNYYCVNPFWLGSMFGESSSHLASFQNTYAVWADPASVGRYGFRPCVIPLAWFDDMNGNFAAQNTENGNSGGPFADLVADLNLRLASYYEPSPLMLQGIGTFNLRPDIMPGCKFSFAPFKDQQEWTFYIDGVSHNYSFGGRATTTLQLTRGLPTPVYGDDALLTALHTGNAQRINGGYQIGLSSGQQGLQALNLQSQQELLGQLARVFVTPGQS